MLESRGYRVRRRIEKVSFEESQIGVKRSQKRRFEKRPIGRLGGRVPFVFPGSKYR